ncbi:MAG: tetratricopeptide repeat protein [Bacteroidetes bacterium]|nr:tetratricopeptide repeat protein [Bacteroidota bacterium]
MCTSDAATVAALQICEREAALQICEREAALQICERTASLQICERTASTSLLIFISLTAIAQDRPAGTTVLPFQQDAVTANNEDQIAMQYFQARNFEQAAEIYALIYPKRPSYYIYTYYLFCLVELREYDEARKLIKTQQKAEPNSLKYQVDQGYVYFREGNIEKAKKLYDDALKRLPADYRQVNELANAFYSKADYEYEISTYKRGRELLPEQRTISFELASAYERTGNYKEAIQEYLGLLSADGNYEPTVRSLLQSMLAQDVDNTKNELLRKALLEAVQKAPDRVNYSEMLWWYSIQQKDFELAFIQAKALDRRLKEDGNRIISLAELAVSNGNFAVAEEAYNYIIAKGPSNAYYDVARRDQLHTRYVRLTGLPAPGNLEELQKSMIAELLRWDNDPRAVRLALDLAHLEAFYMNKPDDALDLLDRISLWRGISEQNRAEVKMELADIHVYAGDMWTATVLYQQIYQDFKNDATGQEAKFRNARLLYYMGQFDWAKAQLDILKAATTKFISNDALKLSMLIGNNYDPDSNTVALGIYARAELADFRNNDELALKTLDSISLLFREHPILDNVTYRKGEIYVKLGKYALADSMFAEVIRNHPVDIITDEALMNRAVIHETWLADKQGAMALYQELLNTYPGSLFVPEARKRFRTLRGDTIQ